VLPLIGAFCSPLPREKRNIMERSRKQKLLAASKVHLRAAPRQCPRSPRRSARPRPWRTSRPPTRPRPRFRVRATPLELPRSSFKEPKVNSGSYSRRWDSARFLPRILSRDEDEDSLGKPRGSPEADRDFKESKFGFVEFVRTWESSHMSATRSSIDLSYTENFPVGLALSPTSRR